MSGKEAVLRKLKATGEIPTKALAAGLKKLLLKIFRICYAPKTITGKGLRVNETVNDMGFEGILGMRIISPEVR